MLTDRLVDLIEPFTSQVRKCYFEIPSTFEGEAAELQFGGEHFAVPITLPTQGRAISVASRTPQPFAPEGITSIARPETEPPPIAAPIPRLKQQEHPIPNQDELLILDVEKALNNHDWKTLTTYTADGEVDYFGRRNTTNDYIDRDMQEDKQTYSSSNSTRYLNTFKRETVGNTIYDSINVYSEVQERRGRLHKALTRLTVGYTVTDGRPIICSFQSKVLGSQPL